MRLGVFGGTFDPPHVGHLVTAVNVRHALSLDSVLLVVANVPWQKVGERAISPAQDRLAMVEAAVRGVPGLDVCRIEIDRGGRLTADTLADLQRLHPGAELFLVLGSDAAAGLTTWERVAEVRDSCSVVVVDRPGAEGQEPPPGWRWQRVEVPRLDVSSTDLRARVLDGRPLDYLIPPDVIACIRTRASTRPPCVRDRRPEVTVAVSAEPSVRDTVVPERAIPRRRRACRRFAPPPATTVIPPPPEPRRGKVHRSRTRPWRTAAIALVMVLIAAAIPTLGAIAGKTIVDSREGRLVEREGRAADIYLPATPTQLLVSLDATGTPESIAVAALSPGSRGGFVILLPTLLRVNVPGVGEGPLGSAYVAGGPALLRQTVESLLDVRLEQVSVLDAATWPRLVSGTVTVSFDDAVGTPGADGRLEVVYPAGPATLTATDLPIAFGAHLPDETEAARLVRYQTLWDGVLTSIDATTPPPPVTSTTVPGEPSPSRTSAAAGGAASRVDRSGRA